MESTRHLLFNATVMDESGELLSHQAIAVDDGYIVWCGGEHVLPEAYKAWPNRKDCQGHLVTPGLIDCHTHLVYAGNRAFEFQMKLEGMSYAEIAKAGGGILSTVEQTRQISEEKLFSESLPRILALKNEGVTTVEIKSGYGLDLESERKILRVAQKLGQQTGLRVRKTFLGAHTVAPEYKNNPQGYVDLLCEEILPALHAEGLVDAVDVFCEAIAFSLVQAQQVFEKAAALGLPIKCHAEQLSNLGASALAASYQALSCEHLEFLDQKGAEAMVKAGTVAVLLPGAYYFLQESQKPPVHLLRALGVSMAIASDCNPGSSPTASLRLMMSMACQFFSLTVPEALLGVTAHAAKALGLHNQVGKIAKGFVADLVLWPQAEPASLCYYFAYPLSQQTMIAGQWLKP